MKLITKDDLQYLRDHVKENVPVGTTYGSEPVPTFVDGKFNSDNWNGGDQLIRQFFSDWTSEDDGVHYGYKGFEVELKYPNGYGFDGNVIISHSHYDDTNYVNIILDGDIYKEPLYGERVLDNVFVSWYKDRGKTDVIKYNSEYITEDQYVFILNILQKTGFNFYM